MKNNFKVKIDISEDAFNYWRGCNSFSHGMDWGKRAQEGVLENVFEKTKEEAFKWLMPYLKNLYQEIDLESRAEEIREMLETESSKIIDVIEEITQKPMYRKDFTLFLTTFNRCLYNSQKGYI